VKPSGIVARPRSLTVAGAAQELNAGYQPAFSPVSRLSRTEDINPGTSNRVVGCISRTTTCAILRERIAQRAHHAASARADAAGQYRRQIEQNHARGSPECARVISNHIQKIALDID
jgi:hypothetical protein